VTGISVLPPFDARNFSARKSDISTLAAARTRGRLPALQPSAVLPPTNHIAFDHGARRLTAESSTLVPFSTWHRSSRHRTRGALSDRR
jgi:hypothetical protein